MAKVDVLKEIVLKKQERILQAKESLPEEDLRKRVQGLTAPLSFRKAITRPREICLIAEIKKASPSQGLIRQDFNHLQIAKEYLEAGVQAVSVLTEEDYFQGNISYLKEVKNFTGLPVLRKDFIIEPYQIYESRLFGADAILLIEDLLTQERIAEFVELAATLGMECLVEVHDEKALKKVLKIKGVSLIGINNRDLHTLEVDPKITEKLYILIPKDRTVVVESGIKNRHDVMFLKILGVNAALIGTAFMQAADIRRQVEEIMGW